MAEENIIKKEKSVTVDSGKSPEVKIEGEATVAPVMDEPIVDAPEAEDLSDVISLLNLMDTNNGGKGAIADIPEDLRGSIKYLVGLLTGLKDLYEDPLYMAINDDLFDQREEGLTPSVEVAIARNIPLDRLQDLADSEDYEGTQSELTDGIAAGKQAVMDGKQDEANFELFQQAGQEYAAEMGYDEARTNELFQKVLDLLQVMGDGVLTKAEFAEVDKMLNYGPDTENLRSKLSAQTPKEVLPDQASIDATVTKTNQAPVRKAPVNAPGMASLAAYGEDTNAKITGTGKRRRV